MLDFRPDEEQKMLTETIARLANDKIRKVYRDAEEDGDIPTMSSGRVGNWIAADRYS
ncbi:MAG: hypothetical protein R3C44_06325 [Chloroflexota bacterium]